MPTLPTFPTGKIKQLAQSVIPARKDFQIHISDSGFDDSKIVRIVTSAWKTLLPAKRIAKFLDAQAKFLEPAEQQQILRYSVLTPEEYKEAVLNSPVKINSRLLYKETN